MKNVLVSTIILMFVCCGEAEATNKKNITNKVIKPETVVNYEPVVPVEINLDDMTFTNAFRIEHAAKGEGRTFWWKGNEYTTNLAETLDEFVLKHITYDLDNLGWVLNNDDPDDNCRSNKLDDCGICDGPGRITWFRDKDRDGLGTFTEWITSCTYPTNIEIEKYQAESLNEGGGDQGVLD
tara:strand:+ start:591 stop:1133 length:543 start_codon:yes stop_codon:yes gene_type:complete